MSKKQKLALSKKAYPKTLSQEVDEGARYFWEKRGMKPPKSNTTRAYDMLDTKIKPTHEEL